MNVPEVDIDIDEIIERYPGKQEYLIFLLQDVQAAFNYISPEAMELISDHTGVPLSQAYSVATFYQSFSLEPKGEHSIKVCLGTACHLKGGPRLVDEIERRLDIGPGGTTEDLKISFDTVNCLGCCALSPVMVVDDEYHSTMTVKKAGKLIGQVSKS